MDNRPGSSSNHVGQGSIKQGSQGWYARLTPEKREEYLQRQRIARQQKKDANRGGLRIVDVSQSSQTSRQISQSTLLTNENISQISGISNMENRPGSSSNHVGQGSIKQGSQEWYARLTPQQKVDYLQRNIGVNSVDVSHRSPTTETNSLRTPFSNITNTQTSGVGRVTIDHKQKGVSSVEGSQKSATNARFADDDSDWLHSNLTYERDMRFGKGLQNLSSSTVLLKMGF